MKRLTLLVLALVSPLVGWAQAINVAVDATQTVRQVDERVFGANAVIWDPQAAGSQTIALLQAAGLRAIRVPGGSLSDEYHWAKNTTLNNTWTWAAHFGSFANLIASLNARAFVTVNYGTGTPQEAAALVAYLNAPAALVGTGADVTIGADSLGTDWKTAGAWSALRAAGAPATDDGSNFLRIGRATPVGVKYWEIGNENYGSWETDQQLAQHDPYTYATRVQGYITRMKAVDPTIKVGVVAITTETAYANNTDHPATNPRTGGVFNGWTPVMLATLKSLGVTPDFIAYHRYEQTPNQENDAVLLQKAQTWASDAADLRRQLNDYLGAVEGPKVEIVVTENNSVYTDPGKQSTSLVNGLYLADSVGNVLQTEINALVWWDLRNGPPTNSSGQIIGNQSTGLYGWRNYGDYGILSTPISGGATTYFEAYPTYYALKLLSYFARQGDSVVKATSTNTLLSVFASKRSDGTMALLVLNKDPVNTLNASVALTGFTPATTASVYTYGMAQDNAAKPGGGGSTDIASTSMTIGGTTFTASFAPYSMTTLVLAAAASTPTNPTTPTTPTVPPAPAVPSAGSGGGGGAPSGAFVVVLALLAATRRFRRR